MDLLKIEIEFIENSFKMKRFQLDFKTSGILYTISFKFIRILHFV